MFWINKWIVFLLESGSKGFGGSHKSGEDAARTNWQNKDVQRWHEEFYYFVGWLNSWVPGNGSMCKAVY